MLSAAASALLLCFAIMGPSPGRALTLLDRAIIGAVFIAVCVWGVLSATNTVHIGGPRPRSNSLGEDRLAQRRRIGHHPDCEGFADHVIVIGNRAFCCGCLGLAIGSVLSILLMFSFIASSWPPSGLGLTLVVIGLLAAALVLLETTFHLRPQAHIAVNTLLPLAFLMITVGTSEATGDVALGLVAILISLLLLETRISISQWKHAETCRKCGRDCRCY